MMRVLYAEDDPQVADMVRLYCSPPGAACTLAHVDSGRKCLAAMAREPFDVLLLDLNMPDLDGLQVLGELTARRDPTPVIMVSGQGQADLAVRALRAGATDCIDKNSPDFRRIGELVQRVHARQQQRRVPHIPVPAGGHRILYLDPEPTERAAVTIFFNAGAPRLHVSAQPPEALEKLLRGEAQFDAVVLGPNLEAAPMLDALRRLRTRDEDMPVVVIAAAQRHDTTLAAFKLGARDFLLRGPGCLTELVFSLNNALKQADTQRLNARLADELAELNRTLARQVDDRTARLLRVQEDERRALAQELHDEVGQLLTGLRFQLEAARRTAPSPKLDEALALSTELLRSVRELTLQLRPRLLDDLGLKPALEWQVRLFERQTGIAIELEITLPEARLASELETAVFRLVQEALTNVARHSGAQAAAVIVVADHRSVQAEVTDRGRGFDAATLATRHDSLGLAGLAERVRLAGGTFELFSQPGQGTRVHAEFKLAP